uniref:Ionotropic receptor 4 n=1 Tax=Cyrtorhinus lividipennis TaxID=1032904 RepID=A0A346TI27_9HEMI|nr:ionotropic receptor 4 [Cyrtorhinus lividipennis]
MEYANRQDTLSERRVAVRVMKSWSDEVDRVLYSKLGIFVDLSCLKNAHFLKEADQSRFRLNHTWLVWDPNQQYMAMNTPQSPYSEVVVASKDTLHQITKFVDELPPELHEVGTFSNNITTLTSLTIKPNLNNKVFKVSYYVMQEIYDPANLTNQMLDPDFQPGFDPGNRFGYATMLLLGDMYNFSMEFFQEYDWGEHLPNGTWTGVIGSIQSGRTDMSISPLFPKAERLDISYAPPVIHNYEFVIAFQQHRKLGTYKAQTMELTPTVWALVGLFALAGGVFFTFTFMQGSFIRALPAGMIQVVGSLASQGLCIDPESASSRIAGLSLMLIGLLLSNYYNAATMTALLSEAPPEIKSFDEFLKTDIPINMVDAAYSTSKLGRIHVFPQEAWPKTGLTEGSPPPKIMTLEDGVKSMKKGDAFFAESYLIAKGVNEAFTDDDKCSLTIFPTMATVNRAFRFLKKDGHLLEMFSRGIIRSMEVGIISKVRDDWIAKPPSCFRNVPFYQVQLEAVTVAFVVLLGGMILSLLIYFCELIPCLKTANMKQPSTLTTSVD